MAIPCYETRGRDFPSSTRGIIGAGGSHPTRIVPTLDVKIEQVRSVKIQEVYRRDAVTEYKLQTKHTDSDEHDKLRIKCLRSDRMNGALVQATSGERFSNAGPHAFAKL